MSGMCLLGIQYLSLIHFIHGFVQVCMDLKEVSVRIGKGYALGTEKVQSENHRLGETCSKISDLENNHTEGRTP